MKSLNIDLPEEINLAEVRMSIDVALFDKGILPFGQA